jgi:hypothetical protein
MAKAFVEQVGGAMSCRQTQPWTGVRRIPEPVHRSCSLFTGYFLATCEISLQLTPTKASTAWLMLGRRNAGR